MPNSGAVAPPASSIEIPEGRAHGNPERLRLPHRAGHGNELPDDGLALGGLVHVVQRLDVVDHAADLQRDARGRDQPSGGGVDQFVLVAGWIEIAQQHQVDRAPASRCERIACHRRGVLLLDRRTCRAGPWSACIMRVQSRQDLRREVLHQLDVFVQQWLALGAVGEHELHSGRRLDRGWEARAARPHHAALPQASDPESCVTNRSSRRTVASSEGSTVTSVFSKSSPVSIMLDQVPRGQLHAPGIGQRAAGRAAQLQQIGVAQGDHLFHPACRRSESRNFTSTESLWRMATAVWSHRKSTCQVRPSRVRSGL